MLPAADIVVFGVASSGSVEQWDRHPTPTGILLRWFLDPPLAYPDLGFDVYRAAVNDVPPLPFNDLNVPSIQGLPSWNYANQITLATASPAGLHFALSRPGWWRLLIASPDWVTATFASPAWFVTVRADAGTTDLLVTGTSAGKVVQQAKLGFPGASLSWRTRGIEKLEISGDGSALFIGYHLLGDPAAWTQIAHRCLPVLDPAYHCAPKLVGTEVGEARSRLPAAVAADWMTRFDAPFAALLPALHRWATGAAPSLLPSALGNSDVRLNADERAAIQLSMLDPHGARILGLAYDDPLGGALDGREYIYKVVGRWLGTPVALDFAGGRLPDPVALKEKYGLTIQAGATRAVPTMTLRFAQPTTDFAITLAISSNVAWTASDGAGQNLAGTLTQRSSRLELASLAELRLTWGGSLAPVISRILFTPTVERVGLLPGIVAAEPGPPAGPTVLRASVVNAGSTSAVATANLDWPATVAADGSIREDQPFSYQVGHRRLNTDPGAAQPGPSPAAERACAVPRFPNALASPSGSLISRAIVACCSKHSIARVVSPRPA